MTEITLQNRITLNKLRVADFSSHETLCFAAEVLLDGVPIANAHNDGHGGCTLLLPINGARARFAAAEAYAKSLPPVVIDLGEPNDRTQKVNIDVTLDYLVDSLASHMHAEKKILAAFNRDLSTKALYVRNNRLIYLKGCKLQSIADKPAFFTQLRAKHGSDIVVLAELPRAEAFALWKRHVFDGAEPMNRIYTLHTELGRGRDECGFIEILKIEPHTCQLSILSSFDRFQCHAVAKVFSAACLCWNEVTRIHFSQMQTKEGLAYLNVTEKDFQADRDRLVQQLLDIFD